MIFLSFYVYADKILHFFMHDRRMWISELSRHLQYGTVLAIPGGFDSFFVWSYDYVSIHFMLFLSTGI
jgi:hypothetical protein